MQETVEIHGSIWKLGDFEEAVAWCKEQEWTLQPYSIPNDHEHCTVCWWSITISENTEVGVAYCSGNRWVCQECFSKFISLSA